MMAPERLGALVVSVYHVFEAAAEVFPKTEKNYC